MLKNKALNFSKQGIAKTHLAFLDNPDYRFAGIFALTPKILAVPTINLSSALSRKFQRFGIIDDNNSAFNIPAVLIAQLSKNYSNNINFNIDGTDLLQIACAKISEAQHNIGGSIVYIECKNYRNLINFYEKNGIKLISDNTIKNQDKLLKMIKFLK